MKLGLENRADADAPKRKHHTNVRDDTLVALQLQAMPTFYWYFTNGITTLQFIIMLFGARSSRRAVWDWYSVGRLNPDCP